MACVIGDYWVVFTGKEEAALVEKDFDDLPGPREITGRNLISLISTGSERGGFTQQFPLDQYPMRTGSSSIARVTRVGAEVTRYKPGDLFFHDKHHALRVRTAEEDTVTVPPGAPPERLIFGRYAAVSMTSIFRMRARPVDIVAVTGLGLVGLMCAQVLVCMGYEVYGVDPSPERRGIAALTTLKNIAPGLDAWPALTKSLGALLECSGNENALRDALPFMRPGSDIFQVGVPWHKNSEWDAHSLLYDLFYAYVSLHGGWEWYLPKKPRDFEIHSSYYHVRTAMELIAEEKMRIVPEMYELRDPRDCPGVYKDIAKPRMAPTAMILDWRVLAD
jgi:threonine dehydrogenase-like Zn-dependent dehydrogenase